MTSRILEQVRLRLFLTEQTQREIERRVGFSRGYLSQLLTGTAELKYWQLLAILHAMDVEPTDFFAELYPRHRNAALESLDDFLHQRTEKDPLAKELARLFAFGIESFLDLSERLEICEQALEELAQLGILERPT